MCQVTSQPTLDNCVFLLSILLNSSIFIGLNFLLKHLAKPEFPRTIATKLTEGRQIVVANKEEALTCYQDSNFIDCRLAAYPYSVKKDPQIIDFVMLDLE